MADITGTSGPDNLTGTSADENITGGAGNDTVSAAAGNDTVFGNAGDDNLLGSDGNDAMSGGNGNDTLKGGAGNDLLLGDAGNDALFGGQGNDTLKGGVGSDQLDGGTGNDVLTGGEDKDRLLGGLGNDIYRFDGSTNDSLFGDTVQEVVDASDLGNKDSIAFTGFTGLGDVNFFQQGNDLLVLYRGTSGSFDNTVTVKGQFSGSAIEQVQLANGKFVSSANINQIIADSAAYAAANGFAYDLNAAKTNANLIAISTAAFHG